MELTPKQVELPSHDKKQQHHQADVNKTTSKEPKIYTITTKNKRTQANIQPQTIKTEKVFFDLLSGLFGACITLFFIFAILGVGILGFVNGLKNGAEVEAGSVIFIIVFFAFFVGAVYSFIKCIIKFVRGLANFLKYKKQIFADFKKGIKTIIMPRSFFAQLFSESENNYVQDKQLPVAETKQALSLIAFFFGFAIVMSFIAGNILISIVLGVALFFVRKQIIAQINADK